MIANKEEFYGIRNLFSIKNLIENDYDFESINFVFSHKKIRQILSSKEITDTVEAFLKNNLNLAQASKNSYMHRNTMIYRIEKIHRITGLNIKEFEDAVIFSNMLYIFKKLKQA